MRKDMQELSNMRVLDKIEEFNAQEISGEWKKFRNCSAEVLSTEKYHILRSYNTIVALIDIEENICYDFLRYVYGFTSTSSQHIAKFRYDYLNYRKPSTTFTYYPI